MNYALIGKIAVLGATVFSVWLAIGTALAYIFEHVWSRHNECWACSHGDVTNRIALFYAKYGVIGIPLAPVLVPIGLVQLALLIRRERIAQRLRCTPR